VRYVVALEQQFLSKLAAKELTATIDSIYTYRDVNTALEHIQSNQNIGKLVLHRF